MMTLLRKKYAEAEDGNMAITFALGMTVIIGVIGTSLDFAAASSANARSQQIADAIALNAAIYVKDHNTPPGEESENGIRPGNHTASSLGYAYKGWVDGGADNVNVNVVYDEANRNSVVTVSGKTNTTFTRVLGFEQLDFSTTSVVSYLDVDESVPASIVLVLDNSGSMRWDSDQRLEDGSRPQPAVARIDALKISTKNFRNELRGRLGDLHKDKGHRILRTGILPYNDQIIDLKPSVRDGMKWRYNGVSNSYVNAMEASGATNSNPPMAMAKEWLDKEENAHRNEAARAGEAHRDPLKFVVFMTDGQNTAGGVELIPNDQSQYWYKEAPAGTCSRKCWYYRTSAAAGFTRGILQLDSDRLTVESCDAMKEQGVEIFSIGFALDEGWYYDPEDEVYRQVTRDVSHTANALLQACATDADNFIEASDGNELAGAFDQIQNAIIKELIRIES